MGTASRQALLVIALSAAVSDISTHADAGQDSWTTIAGLQAASFKSNVTQPRDIFSDGDPWIRESHDGGLTWTLLPALIGVQGAAGLAMTNGKRTEIATEAFFSAESRNNGLYESHDGGRTFQGPATDFGEHTAFTQNGPPVGIDERDPDHQVAAIQSAKQKTASVWVTRSHGRRWTKVGRSPVDIVYFTKIDPHMGDIYLGGENSSNDGRGLFRSRDNGQSWKQVFLTAGDLISYDIVRMGNTLVVATDAGAYRSLDDGSTWDYIPETDGAQHGVWVLAPSKDSNGVLFGFDSAQNVIVCHAARGPWVPLAHQLPDGAYPVSMVFDWLDKRVILSSPYQVFSYTFTKLPFD